MEKSDTLILGGGISGLSMRFFLSQQNPKASITLLEAGECVGGVIAKGKQGNQEFPLGPKTFAARRCPELLALIDALGLSDRLKFSSPHAKYRYLAKNGEVLQPLPASLWDFIKKPSYRQWIGPLLTEWRKKTGYADETIEAFAKRRFGPEIAKTLFDPMTIGIFGGDYKKLSVAACFPELKAMEEQFGSITKALLFKKKKQKTKGLFTLEGGMTQLIKALKEQGRGVLYESAFVKSCEKVAGGWLVKSQKGEFFAKKLVVATDLVSCERLLSRALPAITHFKAQTPTPDMHYMTLQFKENLFSQFPGFGFITPSDVDNGLLGVIFDSHIYPEQKGFFFTALCNKPLSESQVSDKLYKLAKSDKPLVFSHTKHYKSALPQFLVGHKERVEQLDKAIKECGDLVILGNFLKGVSVEACVKGAHQSALILKM